MASHPTYPHPGPGPSSYYQQSPPPHHVYGNHSPGPRPNYYGYNLPPPPPPHMSSHQPTHYHQPPTSRGNHRGNGGGSYNSRGTHHYHHHYQQQSPYPHAHVTPVVGVHAPHVPYSPQSSKYNQPYSPSYSYPSPTAPVFTPSWQQQPLSPLPKQLSMPPPQHVDQNLYDSASVPVPPTEPTAEFKSAEQAAVFTTTSTEGTDSETSPLSSPESLELTAQPSQASSYSQMGTISTSTELASLPSTTQQKLVVKSIGKWAVWSRRPRDPIQAPSIIISPHSYPPPDVIQQALDQKTPPPSLPSSPVVPRKSLFSSPDVSRKQHLSLSKEREEAAPPAKDVPLSPPSQSSDEIAGAAWSSQTTSSVPSSSVTETTDTPTIPGSPASSHTSLSIKDSKEILVQNVEVDAGAAAVPESTSAPTASVVPEPQPSEAEVSDTKPAEAAAPAADGAIPVSVRAPTVVVSAAADVAAPQPIAAQELPAVSAPTASPQSTPAATPAIKKSWASLLRPSSSASASPTSGSSRNALPTSSVVGFSIPASTTPPVPAVSPSKKSELVTLLTSGPAPTTAASVAAGASSASSVMKIRPRGLINSGNMCFANSVLQILVYCLPFHGLFVDLGKVLGAPGSSAGAASGTNSPALNGREDRPKAASATPLVDATIEFLKEFVEDKKSKSKEKARLEVVSRSGSVNGVSGSGTGRSGGKGKEKEILREEEDEDDWDGESFLPTYVYDAMKEKKRFDNMRGGHQEDAEEFFGFYLDTLEEELLSLLHSVNPPRQNKVSSSGAAVEEKEEAAPPEDEGWLEVGKKNRMVITRTIKATESPITRIFGGKFRSTLRAPGQKDSVVVEDWRSLRLDIQREQIHTIQDALSYISHPQPVQVTQPTKPGMTIDAQQQVLIEALPPILVLHIKRFCYDTSVGGVVKVGKQVRFGPELEIGSDVMVPAAKKAHPTRYKLFGALYHHGLSAGGGHYTLDVLHPNRYPSANPSAKPREGWVRIDDNLVSDVRPEDVFEQNERDDARSAYLLFYRRV